MIDFKTISIWILLLPLASSIIAGIFGKKIGKTLSHLVTTSSVGVAFVLSFLIYKALVFDGALPQNIDLYTWGIFGSTSIHIGVLLDKLTALMMVVVSFVSFMVHIYTIGYMKDDPGYQRFFSYIALFTFAMLTLVMSNNFLQLFFGWEGVGVVSYLLIGFWYKKESAIFANLKAFLVNRVGDFGFLIGIAAVFYYFGSLEYSVVFSKVDTLAKVKPTIEVVNGLQWSALTLIAISLFVGAMGKSAQVPLHVWLPDSMEGPTPISALIHAATMVTAGVFMVARMSPIFEYSDVALNFVMTIGAVTCLFMGLLAVVQNDIKRIIAYSTLSQLGYMVTALGASAYSVAIFHLGTHAFFKALLFLGAGSVIIAMHHKQDIREMGNLRKYMPITYATMLIGTLAIIGFPFFSGFYSKDLIIEAVHASNLSASHCAYFAVLGSVFVTSLYSFRLLILTFHTKERMDDNTKAHLKESPLVVTLPLVLLAVPSVFIGYYFVGDVLQDFFVTSIDVQAKHHAIKEITKEFHGAFNMGLHGITGIPFVLAVLGFITAWFCYIKKPELPKLLADKFKVVYKILMSKYGFDNFYQNVIVQGIRAIGWFLWKTGDEIVIDQSLVNGAAHGVDTISSKLRRMQTGYLYHYAFAIISGFLILLLILLFWF